MIVEKVCLTNFMNFYGVHSFEFKRGFNVVIGPCGSGKTNIARAIKFALSGLTEIKRVDLINYKHKQEGLKEVGEAFCEVEITVQRDDKKYLAKSKLSLNKDGVITQATCVPSQFEDLITPDKFKLIYLEPLNLVNRANSIERRKAFSELLMSALKKCLIKNFKFGLKMAIIDSVFGLMSETKSEEFLNLLRKTALEQVIFLETRLRQSNPLLKDPENWQINLSNAAT